MDLALVIFNFLFLTVEPLFQVKSYNNRKHVKAELLLDAENQSPLLSWVCPT